VKIIVLLFKAGYSFEQILAELAGEGRVSLLCHASDCGYVCCACAMVLFEKDCTLISPERSKGGWGIVYYNEGFCRNLPADASSTGLSPQGGDGPCAETDPVIPAPQSYTLYLSVYHIRELGNTLVPPEDWALKLGSYGYLYSALNKAEGSLSGNSFTSQFVSGDTKLYLSGFLSSTADQITSFVYTEEEKFWTAIFKGGPIPFTGELYPGTSNPGRIYELRGQAVCNAITEYKYDWPKDVGPQQAHYARELVCDEYSYFKIEFNPEPPYEY